MSSARHIINVKKYTNIFACLLFKHAKTAGPSKMQFDTHIDDVLK